MLLISLDSLYRIFSVDRLIYFSQLSGIEPPLRIWWSTTDLSVVRKRVAMVFPIVLTVLPVGFPVLFVEVVTA